jgi:predicted CXXCH cytochrome family protein
MFLSAIIAMGGTVAMTNSLHDLSTGSSGPSAGAATNFDEICAFCHVPHQAAGANVQDPLWNHTLSSNGDYGMYASDTLTAVPTDFGGGTAGSANVSQLCMSCHDGSVGLGNLYQSPTPAPDNAATNISAGFSLGTNLTNDHPINFLYDNALFTADGGLVDPDSTASVDATGLVPLFAGTMQCASCHDPHDDTNFPFLVVTNADSGLCAECHTK